MNKKRVLVAMSGGVDSAAAALLLKRDGYDISGVTMRLWNECSFLKGCKSDAPDENSIQAKEIADKLCFEHFSIDMSGDFNEGVVIPFINDYKNGKTPNPCVECNKRLKFGRLLDLACEKHFDFLATGHYARIEKGYNGEMTLKKARDEKKDQSYFLWSIKKENLSKIILPLGEFTKPQIREIARENGFSNADRGDSQDICFIPNGDYTSFLEKYGCVSFTKGKFIDLSGNVLGVHNGLERYTVGQRKGLGIALGKPMFVCEKSVTDNTVTLCDDIELYKKELTASQINLLVNDTLEGEIRVEAKIRYRHKSATATVRRIDGDTLSVIFDVPQRAITKGQSLVLYDGDTVIGGGIIN